jgi:hypothetical protein
MYPADLDQVAQLVVSDQEITTISLAFGIVFGIVLPIGTLLLFVIVKSLKSYIKPRVLNGDSATFEVVEKINATGEA